MNSSLQENLPARTLLELTEKHKKVSRYLEEFRKTVKLTSPLFCQLEQTSEATIIFDFDAGFISLMFSGKSEVLSKVWKGLRQSGYKPHQRPSANSATVTTLWRQDGLSTIWMYFTSTSCQKIQVGTKLVEQPIYEVRCTDTVDLP